MKTSTSSGSIYFQDYVVVDPGDTPLKERQLLTEEEFREAREKYGDAFKAGMGAEAVKAMLAQPRPRASSPRELREDLERRRSPSRRSRTSSSACAPSRRCATRATAPSGWSST